MSCECKSSMISSCVLVSVNYTYVVWHSLLVEYFICMWEWSMVWTSGCNDKNFPHEIKLFLNLLLCLLYYGICWCLFFQHYKVLGRIKAKILLKGEKIKYGVNSHKSLSSKMKRIGRKKSYKTKFWYPNLMYMY